MEPLTSLQTVKKYVIGTAQFGRDAGDLVEALNQRFESTPAGPRFGYFASEKVPRPIRLVYNQELLHLHEAVESGGFTTRESVLSKPGSPIFLTNLIDYAKAALEFLKVLELEQVDAAGISRQEGRTNHTSGSNKNSGDIPDAMGMVSSPADPTTYESASDIVAEHAEIVPDIKELNRILRTRPDIRRWKPSQQRLKVHLGNWNRYVREHGGKDPEGWVSDQAEVERNKTAAFSSSLSPKVRSRRRFPSLLQTLRGMRASLTQRPGVPSMSRAVGLPTGNTPRLGTHLWVMSWASISMATDG